MQPLVYVRRLELHHFAYLRSIAEGVDATQAVKRYLGINHGYQVRATPLQVRDAIRAVAKRKKLSSWRLIGLSLVTIQPNGNYEPPSLETFMEIRNLDEWSENEILLMYQEAYPQIVSFNGVIKYENGYALN